MTFFVDLLRSIGKLGDDKCSCGIYRHNELLHGPRDPRLFSLEYQKAFSRPRQVDDLIININIIETHVPEKKMKIKEN